MKTQTEISNLIARQLNSNRHRTRQIRRSPGPIVIGRNADAFSLFIRVLTRTEKGDASTWGLRSGGGDNLVAGVFTKTPFRLMATYNSHAKSLQKMNISLLGMALAFLLIMGRRLRLWEPDKIYNVSTRVVDRQFAFVPNHSTDNPLLREDSHPDSLAIWNNLVPKPSTINIIGAGIARALEQYPVPLYWVDGNISHNHGGLGPNPDAPDNASMFLQCTNSLIARMVNKQWGREGHLFTAAARTEPVIDDDAAEKLLFYSLLNPVKDGLVETVRQSPFFSCYRHLAYGDPLKFWFIDWHRWWKAGGFANKKHRVKQYLKWTEFELTPLPAWQDLTIHQRQTRVRKRVKELEEQYAAERKLKNRTVIGVAALYRTDPRDRPANPKDSGRQPLCHTTDKELRREFRKKWREFVVEHRKASADYRNGYHEREFPDGSFRPPIKTIYDSSHR